MAEPTTSTDNASEGEAKPKLVALDPQAEAPAPEPTPPSPEASPAGTQSRQRGPWIVALVLAVLLAIAGVWAAVQSQQLDALGARNVALTEQVQGLEVQLSAATLQIQTFEMQQDLIRTVAADLAAQVGRLQELVAPAPAAAVQTEAP